MKSFVDKLGWFRWTNTTGWSTEDIEAIVNAVADSFSPQGVKVGRPSNKFRRGIRMISIRESSGSGDRMPSSGTKYLKRGDEMKPVVSAASWSDATIHMLRRDRWYDSEVQALTAMTDKGHAPQPVVRQLASAIHYIFREIVPGTDFEIYRGGTEPDFDTLPLRRKINKLEGGEVEVNPTLRFRSYRQAYIGAAQANKTYGALYTLLHRAVRFEKNNVGTTLTEEQLGVIKEAMMICDRLGGELRLLADQHINSLKSID